MVRAHGGKYECNVERSCGGEYEKNEVEEITRCGKNDTKGKMPETERQIKKEIEVKTTEHESI